MSAALVAHLRAETTQRFQEVLLDSCTPPKYEATVMWCALHQLSQLRYHTTSLVSGMVQAKHEFPCSTDRDLVTSQCFRELTLPFYSSSRKKIISGLQMSTGSAIDNNTSQIPVPPSQIRQFWFWRSENKNETTTNRGWYFSTIKKDGTTAGSTSSQNFSRPAQHKLWVLGFEDNQKFVTDGQKYQSREIIHWDTRWNILKGFYSNFHQNLDSLAF